MNKTIVLLSGGLDSATCLVIAQAQGQTCYALTFDYGQKHRAELQAAQRIAQAHKVAQHLIFPLPINKFGGSALTDANIAIPDYQANFQTEQQIPVTYVPARNTIFLAIAMSWAEVVGATEIAIGVNAVDYSGYPDCRPEFIQAFEQLLRLATKSGVEGATLHIQTPLLHLSKTEIIQLGTQLGANYAATVSCYRANEEGEACGNCDSCVLRRKGFEHAGITDPTRYFPS
jgi:7-cyano-7-deazaguanine synthase